MELCTISEINITILIPDFFVTTTTKFLQASEKFWQNRIRVIKDEIISSLKPNEIIKLSGKVWGFNSSGTSDVRQT